MIQEDKPRLFGIKYSNRDFTNAETWGKNQFNSSFPAALVAYMFSKNIDSVYITTNNNKIQHRFISGDRLFGISPLSDNAFYAFESVYTPYQPFYIGNTPRIDLVIQNKDNGNCISGLEVKLTALPDNSTCNLAEDQYSSEIVIRPDTISYLACSIAKHYLANTDLLKHILGDFSIIKDWEDPNEVISNYHLFVKAATNLIVRHQENQEPLILEPVWKTKGKAPILAENCLDVFVWSNLAVIHLFTDFSKTRINKIGRTERTLIWLVKMLWDFSQFRQFHAEDIIDRLSFNTKNDKAFSVNGHITYPMLKSKELTNPRIKKDEIKNIILGGGQNLLSPERRFDAILFNSPNLFK